jgi:RNA polymerase sigma-70 factor (ECF subfamily)
MSDTSPSLLEKVRNPKDAVAWGRFVSLYTPLLRHWLSRSGLPPQDTDDLVQQVLTVVAGRLPEFRYDPGQGRFRGWLRVIVAHCLRNHQRKQRSVPTATGDSAFLDRLAQLEDERSSLSREWDIAHDRHVLLGLCKAIEPEFEPATIAAFRRTVLQGEPNASVSADLGLSVNAVLVARSKVLKRLRQEMAGLTD